ncbi:hypothetical protein CPB86DRAFT_784550 [Serendipita vermifera]|nr:hypothetical protein CPB86DRAFT_784550 [Serendipita vermifera]
MSGSKGLHLLDLNDDVLFTMSSCFEAVELLNWSMTCKRLHRLTNSPKLWLRLAKELEERNIPLPLYFGETAESCTPAALRKATSRACLLHRNLTSGHPKLYKQTIWRTMFATLRRHTIPAEAESCIKIFDGRWVLFRRPDVLSVRHVYSTKAKEVFDIPLIGYAGWPIELSQVSKKIGLVAIRHDVKEEWMLLELTFGEDKSTKPRYRHLNVGHASRISLLEGGMVISVSRGSERLLDVYANKGVFIGNSVLEKRYTTHHGYIFSVFSVSGGLIQAASRPLDKNSELSNKPWSKIVLNLGNQFADYPPDQFHTETFIRPSGREKQVTIWHRVHTKVEGDEVLYATFIINLQFSIEEVEGKETFSWGVWTFRTTYTPPGSHYIGEHGMSSVLARYQNKRAGLTLYPRFMFPLNHYSSKIIKRGISLPAPPDSCSGEDVFAIRIAWDDVHGIAALLFESGMLWILHYA